MIIFFSPVAKITDAAGQVYSCYISKLKPTVETENVYQFPLIGLLIVVFAVFIFCFFKYKNRILQIRLLVFNIVCQLSAIVLIYLYVNKFFENATINYSIICSFLAINLILSYLAIRSIGKDEVLIKSIDRIR
jgi:hypothetical protein